MALLYLVAAGEGIPLPFYLGSMSIVGVGFVKIPPYY